MAHERYVRRLAEAIVPTAYGDFRMIAYESEINGDSHIALVKGDVEHAGDEPVLVRMHSHCLVGDVFGASWCECRNVIDASMRRIAEEGRGALIYLHSTSKGYSVERLGERMTIQFHHEEPAQDPARNRHRRADTLGPKPQTHPHSDQPSAQSRRPGRLRHRDRRAGPYFGREQNRSTVG
jgi:3,4-dihydroxy 2-butanone 4-phosphate synthase/GTP cyclohydrolase II